MHSCPLAREVLGHLDPNVSLETAIIRVSLGVFFLIMLFFKLLRLTEFKCKHLPERL